MYLLLAVPYLCIACDISPLVPFSIIKTILISVSNSNFTLALFKQVSIANLGVVQKYAGSNSYSFKHKVLNFSNISAYCVVSDWTYKSWHSPKFLILKVFHTFCACLKSSLLILFQLRFE